MPTIGLIDDKKDQRESLRKLIQNHVEKKYKGWECIDIYPIHGNLSQYISWICEHDIAVLLIDEQLQEAPLPNGKNVNYNAHELIDFIRKAYPVFPVYAITAYAFTEGLKEKKGAFDDILEKENLAENSEEFTDRFIRAGQRFTEVNIEELNILSEVSRALAEGEHVDKSRIKQANAIQQRMEIPFTIEGIITRTDAIFEYDKQLTELEKIADEIKKYLDK